MHAKSLYLSYLAVIILMKITITPRVNVLISQKNMPDINFSLFLLDSIRQNITIIWEELPHCLFCCDAPHTSKSNVTMLDKG